MPLPGMLPGALTDANGVIQSHADMKKALSR
jgi:hypothetical protein